MKFDPDTLAAKPTTFGTDEISEMMWFLIHHRLLPLHRWWPKPGTIDIEIPYGALRADLISNYQSIIALGQLLIQKIDQVELELNRSFDTILVAGYSGIPGAMGIAHVLSQRGRYINIAIERKYHEGEVSLHPIKKATHVGEIKGCVLVHDEQINTGSTITRLVKLAQHEGADPIAAVAIADRIYPFLPRGERHRDLGVPAYNMINHNDIVHWCETNPEIYQEYMLVGYEKINFRTPALELIKQNKSLI